ncbi:MAG: hypothetical protein HY002_07875, partial [Candidatus Rokubacteria bacterium]|nr:hypothetical protein [Candidatus Rokubacteria bacterium]
TYTYPAYTYPTYTYPTYTYPTYPSPGYTPPVSTPTYPTPQPTSPAPQSGTPQSQGAPQVSSQNCETVWVEGHYETRVMANGQRVTAWVPAHSEQVCR